MRLTIHQLSVFKSVADMGSVSLAAKSMHLTQPAVSNILKTLEDYFGCPLFEVINKQRHLTSAGERVLMLANRIQTDVASTENDIHEMMDEYKGPMKVAVVSTAKYFIPRLLGAFAGDYPDAELSLKVANRETIIERLEMNEDDFVIMSQPPSSDQLLIEPFYDDQLVVAASVNHPLAKVKKLSWQELADVDWVMREKGSGTRIVMKNLFESHGIDPRIVMQLDNNESIKQLMIANIGISIVSMQSIELELYANLLTTLNVEGFPLPHPWYLVSHKNKHTTKLVKAFKEFVRTHRDIAHFHG